MSLEGDAQDLLAISYSMSCRRGQSTRTGDCATVRAFELH